MNVSEDTPAGLHQIYTEGRQACEQGLNFLEEFPDSTASGAMRSIVEALLVQLDQN